MDLSYRCDVTINKSQNISFYTKSDYFLGNSSATTVNFKEVILDKSSFDYVLDLINFNKIQIITYKLQEFVKKELSQYYKQEISLISYPEDDNDLYTISVELYNDGVVSEYPIYQGHFYEVNKLDLHTLDYTPMYDLLRKYVISNKLIDNENDPNIRNARIASRRDFDFDGDIITTDDIQ
jgi:hypothetical protein